MIPASSEEYSKKTTVFLHLPAVVGLLTNSSIGDKHILHQVGNSGNIKSWEEYKLRVSQNR